MKRNTIRLVVVLATLSIFGIIVTQLLWVKRAFDFREKEFDQQVTAALTEVTRSIVAYNNHPYHLVDPVRRLSDSYYVVLVNDIIHDQLLKDLLKNALEKRGIRLSFQYMIYDCASKGTVYSEYISLDGSPADSYDLKKTFPQWRQDNYYFGISFLNRDTAILGQMGFWWFSSAVLLIVIIFFAYGLFVILKQRRLSEIQHDFINNMTHEFKTPISTIAISSEVLKNPGIVQTPERLLSYATIIGSEADRLRKGVERVLQMAAVDRHEVKLKTESVELHELIVRAAEPFQVALSGKEGHITFDLRAYPCTLQADRLHLTNVLYNLLDNAVKYTVQSPNIQIQTVTEKHGIFLRITDNGIGIEPVHQKRIFEKFYRVPTGNRHDVKGFGLGLHYVRSMVKAHGGFVRLQSELGRGSTFSLFLPRK